MSQVVACRLILYLLLIYILICDVNRLHCVSDCVFILHQLRNHLQRALIRQLSELIVLRIRMGVESL